MSQIEALFFNCNGTLVDSEIIRFRAHVTMFGEFDIHVDLEKIFIRFKDAKLYEIIDVISKEQGATMVQADAECIYRVEVVHLSDTKLEDIAGTSELLTSINVPICVVSNSPVSKMQHSLDKLSTLHYSPEKLFDGYNIQHWKSSSALVFHAAKTMNVNVENYILVDDSSAGAQSGIGVGVEVLYSCTDPRNRPIVHPKVITFAHLSQLPKLWEACG